MNALLGSWGRKGGFYYPANMNVPGYPYPAYPKPQKEKADNPGNKYPFADEAITTGIREATITGKPYPIKGWFVYATNLMEALPNAQETIRAMQNLDLMVVVDVIPSEIAGWADVVLPESRLSRAIRRPECRVVPRTVCRLAPACCQSSSRSETQLVDCARAGREAGIGELFPLERHRGISESPAFSGGLELR